MRQDLSVPYADKDAVKELGARWDRDAKTWYVPPGEAVGPFQKWIAPPEESANFFDPAPTVPVVLQPHVGFNGDLPQIRAKRFAIARAEAQCWKCKKDTTVAAILLLHGFDRLDDAGQYQRENERVSLLTIRRLDQDTHNVLNTVASNVRYATSKTGGDYFANHCGHCDCIIGDSFLHSKPGAAFYHLTDPQAKHLVLHRCATELSADANDAKRSWLDAISVY
jgi:hypothetical protein